jgi:hypothetical protein
MDATDGLIPIIAMTMSNQTPSLTVAITWPLSQRPDGVMLALSCVLRSSQKTSHSLTPPCPPSKTAKHCSPSITRTLLDEYYHLGPPPSLVTFRGHLVTFPAKYSTTFERGRAPPFRLGPPQLPFPRMPPPPHFAKPATSPSQPCLRPGGGAPSGAARTYLMAYCTLREKVPNDHEKLPNWGWPQVMALMQQGADD